MIDIKTRIDNSDMRNSKFLLKYFENLSLSKCVFKTLTFIFFLYGFRGCNPLKILMRQNSSSRGNLEV